MSVSSYDTLGSDDEINTASVGSWSSNTEEHEESIVQNQYDAYTAKLEADIDYWTTLAAKYEEDEDLNFEWPKTPICAYDKGIIMLKNAEYIAEGDLESSQELHDRHSWLAEYIEKKTQDDERELLVANHIAETIRTKEESEDDEEDHIEHGHKFKVYEKDVSEDEDEDYIEPGRPIGIYRKAISDGRAWRARKDQKKKYAHKTIDTAGRVKEAPYAPIKKPYPSWRKKKTGRNHKETLVPRKPGEFVREIVECYSLPCSKLDAKEEEEPDIEFFKNLRAPIMNLRGVKRVLF
jgi:hypothetical protein